MSIEYDEPVVMKAVAALEGGDVCLIKPSFEVVLAIAANAPNGDRRLVRFANSKEATAIKLVDWSEVRETSVPCYRNVRLLPDIASLVPYHQGNTPIGALAVTPDGLKVIIYPGDATRQYLSLKDGALSADPLPPLPFYRRWSLCVRNGADEFFPLKTVSV